MLKVYKTGQGILIEKDASYFVNEDLTIDDFIENPQLEFTETSSRLSHERFLEMLQSIEAPIGLQEIWAAGVTYYRSREARMNESADHGGDSFYDRVYNATRPELFYKSSSHRVRGHNQGIRIRKDSKWNVPEPELTLVISPSGQIIGYTIGNDVSSRDIEGENPLYLPQAKTYDGSAAIGPSLLLTTIPVDEQTKIKMEIRRKGESVFSGETEVSMIKRSLQSLVDYVYMECSFPNGCFLMTGTGIIPPNDFTLQAGDTVEIGIDKIGVLKNTVED